MIYHWQTTRSIPKRAKIISLVTIVLAVSWSCYMLESVYLKVAVVALVACPFIFICRLPLAEESKQVVVKDEQTNINS